MSVTPFDVALKRPVFVLYAGLTASGYDLAEKYAPPGGELWAFIQDVRSQAWPEDVLAYFRMARLEGQGINPYWPRAGMLINAVFHLAPGDPASLPGYEDEAEVLKMLRRFPTGPDNKGPETVGWIREYPRIHRAIENLPFLEALWQRFSGWMGDRERLEPFCEAARDAVSALGRGLGLGPADIPHFTVVPNPLQAPQLADFVRKDGRLYAILAAARPESILHEVLHSVFEKAISRQQDAILARRGSLYTAQLAEAMVKMQYAWDDGPASWLRVYEESMVRAATIWMSTINRQQEADRLALAEAQAGFFYVPAMLRAFRDAWCGPGQIDAFLARTLRRL
ncbi:MAG TPA: hypothetical protein GX500_08850 [Firmicutes bacterium]|nr:hypothetical protein [Candidatus Fermentithermobacillaceae bacterium]